MPPPREHFHQVMQDADELFLVYTGSRMSAETRQSWGKNIAERMFSKGEDPLPVLKYIEWALRDPEAAKKHAGG